MIPLAEGTFGPGGTRWFDLANRVTGAARRVLLWAPRSAGLLHLSEINVGKGARMPSYWPTCRCAMMGWL